MLKRLLAAVALAACCAAAARAADEPAVLAVGAVRDQTGRPLPALVVAVARDGREVGRDTSAPDGTFSILLSGPAANLRIVCTHCARLQVPYVEGTPAIVIVTRYRALDRSDPDERDLAALPYKDAGDTAGLAPYVLAVPSGPRIAALSDRGLERGRGLVFDGGMPIYDPSTGSSALFGFPGRSVAALHVSPAARAFTYSSYAGGGSFGFDRLGDEPQTSARFDTGLTTSFALTQRVGEFFPSVARSRDEDGVERRRADAAFAGEFAGGVLRAEASAASQHPDDLSIAEDHSRELISLSYATASRHYRTFLDAGAFASRGGFVFKPGGSAYGTASSSVDLNARIEHVGPIELAIGSTLSQVAGAYTFHQFSHGAVYGTQLVYLEAAHDGPLSFDVGLSASSLTLSRPDNEGGRGSVFAFLPSVRVGAALGGGFKLHAGISTSARVPTLFELQAGAYEVEQGNLIETALGYDDGRRLRAEATAFRQQLSGLGARTMNGVGVSVAWQVAPRLSLRAWTLHDASTDTVQTGFVLPYAPSQAPSLERGVLWASYEGPLGLRVDLIAHSYASPTGATANVDAGIVVPLRSGISLTAGSARRDLIRRSYFGLRLQ